ncbi:hypothetical protein K2173_014233 [Erythroxylum novogranatense]|uniref:Uncharacterized protein n=1 Tax=Erythroxylum novogranatense TaxID=1862640 RepID=A0AAV8SE76_9ROSI|nr:hypothetical protein K2173_014233 [Erythroxylum novogranatense]
MICDSQAIATSEKATNETLQQMKGVETTEHLPQPEEVYVQHLNDPPDLDGQSGALVDQPNGHPVQNAALQQPDDRTTGKLVGDIND